MLWRLISYKTISQLIPVIVYAYQEINACKHGADGLGYGNDIGVSQTEIITAVMCYAWQIPARTVRDIIARY